MKYKVILLVMFLSACNSEHEKNNSEAGVVMNHEDSDEKLRLNNGEKWVVEKKMMTFISEMENRVNEFNEDALPAFMELSQQLGLLTDSLTSNCTMKGESHDELHKWLVPYMDLIDDLSYSESTEEAGVLLEEVRSSFKTFREYFQ